MPVKLIKDTLEPNRYRDAVKSLDAGGECQFLGTVRQKKDGSAVKHLFFEAYEPMALKEMEKIVIEAKDKFEIIDLLIYHRLGYVEPGDFAVVIIASAAHREASFKACKFAIDTLKKSVPIWKKEVMEDGEVWVSAHP